jgi:hypothetical protein
MSADGSVFLSLESFNVVFLRQHLNNKTSHISGLQVVIP